MALAVENVKLTGVGIERPVTDIDRRGCHRVVPMKVLCFGLCRTGTSSLRAALIQLGIEDVYHMHELLYENQSDYRLWLEAIEAKYEGKGKPYGKKEWDALLGHCMGVTDFPCVAFAEELIHAYPEAKIILTVRDNPDAWIQSTVNTIYSARSAFDPPNPLFHKIMSNIMSPPKAFAVAGHFFHHFPIGSPNFPNDGTQWYAKHNEDIRSLAAKSGAEFLEFNVKEGWGPLCEFLDVKRPDVPFPRVNDTESWREDMNRAKKAALLDLATKALMGLGGFSVAVLGLSLVLHRMRW